jgi:hypothetical protein
MKRWAWLVAGLYVLALAVLTVPVCLAAFVPKIEWAEPFELYASFPYWVWLAVMLLCQFALLAVPVRVASRRPVTKGALWPTVLAAGLMMGGLLFGAVSSVLEFIFAEHGSGNLFWVGIGAGVMLWVIWAIVFFRQGRTAEPTDFFSRQCKLLLKGSILELLIAVPTHIVARARDYCCAGFMTFFGLTMGISVMLFCFGPAVFFLYADRWRKLHPESSKDTSLNNNPI